MPIRAVSKIANKNRLSSSWSAEQCVEGFLEDIRAKKVKPIKLMIAYFEEDGNGNLLPRRYYAQINDTEEIALLTLLTKLSVDDWFK